jgi:glycosyltransferase involved in cell wall biosynthesis
MMKDLVSVVIPVYNREKTIVRAVKSVLNQTYKNIEVIIVDDCSSDNSRVVIENAFSENNNVRYICLEKNSGACVARNRGVQLSKGKYVAFLDSDDAFLPNKIEKQISCLCQTNAQLCATDYIRYRKDGSEEIVKTKSGSQEEVYNELLYCNFITTGTLLGYKECFVEVPFDESLPRYQDWDLVLRLSQKYTFCFLKENTLLQYFQPISITASTNHEKTIFALEKIFKNNEKQYQLNKKALGQICWLLGLHYLFDKDKRYSSFMWKGVILSNLLLRRFIVYVYALLGGRKIIKNFFC